MDKSDIEYLEDCLKHTYKVHGLLESGKIWYSSNDTMLTVARILNGEGDFLKPEDVIYFFEKPWKYEIDMKELINDYKEAYANETL